MKLRLVTLAMAILIFSSSATPPVAVGAPATLCFDAPGITHCISGAFLDYWESAGGLAVFGYPISGELTETTAAGGRAVQYFERARLEYHAEQQPAYKVQLGRLGAELFDAASVPGDTPQAGCRHFATTGHNVCGAFLKAWHEAGTEAGQRALDIFGYPLSAPLETSGAAGQELVVQWFERARFELHPDGAVRLGLVGRELLASQQEEQSPQPEEQPPQPAQDPEPQPSPTPAPPPPPPPPAVSAPAPQVPCNKNVPTPQVGLQIWATESGFAPPEDAVICVRLLDAEGPVQGITVQTFRYTPDGEVSSIHHSTNREGVADFIFYLGAIPPGTTVSVKAVAGYQGQSYEVWTSFVRY